MSKNQHHQEKNHHKDPRALDRARIFPILLIIFTNILGAGVILPVLPLYAEGQFQGTVFQITLLSTAYFGAQFIAAPWLGRLSDRFGRRPLLMISQAGTVAAFLLFIFAGPLGRMIDTLNLGLPLTGGMVMLYAARTLDGITGGNITIAQAYISDVTTSRQRAQGLGLLQAAFGMGFIFGPAFGGVLGNYGPVAPFIGAAVITLGTLILTALTLEESLPPEKRTAAEKETPERSLISVLREFPTLGVILAMGFIGSLAFSALPSVFSLYADRVIYSGAQYQGRVELYIGLMLTFNGLMQVVTQLALLKPLVERLGERRLLSLGQLSLLMGMLGIAFLTRPVLATLLLAPFAFGRGVTEPGLQSLTTRFATESTQGQLLGFYQSARSVALIFGPIWAGYAFESISPRAVFLVGAGFIAINLVLSLILNGLSLPGEARDSIPG
jgi:DHA1 family tetracycline resistance protein-like MFS transporter